MKRRPVLELLVLMIVTLVAAACAPAAAPAPAAPAATQAPAASVATQAPTAQNCPNPHGANGKCKVALVNSFLGNDYRIFMQEMAVKASNHEPFKSEWEPVRIVNSENTAEAQNAVLENLIAEGVDAILLDAVSDTSASDVVKKACDNGVVVVTFDITDKADAPCEYRIDFDFKTYTTVVGRWVGRKLGCKGNVVIDKGLTGVSIAQDMFDGYSAGLQQECGDGIKVVATYYGEFGPGPQAQAVPGILAANPQIDGWFADTTPSVVFKAFEDAGRKPPVMGTGYGNPDAVMCIEKGYDCAMNATSWGPAIGAMETAYKVFHGQPVERLQGWDNRYYATDTSIDVGVPFEKLEIGKNAFPDKPATFTPAYNWQAATLQLSEEEAYGK